jgi:NAD+ kinase
MRLDVEVRRAGSDPVRLRALNEAVVEKSEPGHTVRLEVELDGRPFTSYVADGLVLATPTGSTAYSFSVRGPIVDPEHRAVLLAPVAPHMLFDRTMVLRPDCEVRVTVAGGRTAGLSVDGRGTAPLQPGDQVVCSGGQRPARLVTFGTSDFHSVLRQKFGLSER